MFDKAKVLKKQTKNKNCRAKVRMRALVNLFRLTVAPLPLTQPRCTRIYKSPPYFYYIARFPRRAHRRTRALLFSCVIL